jgi:hypothetical protein
MENQLDDQRRGKVVRLAGALALLSLTSAAATSAGVQTANPSPTCSEELGITVHGQHVIGDYVTGISHEELVWPPDGAEIGSTIAENGGVVVVGGPGPGFHFLYDIAPGASFCTDAHSWGVPRGR